MALIIPNELTLRTLEDNRLTVTAIDQNQLYNQEVSLASSNALIYLSASFSVDTFADLGKPSSGYFNSRTIPSFLHLPFQNGCNFVFKFSSTDYGYMGSASVTDLWWSTLSEDISYKILSISQIDTRSGYWEFNLTSISFTSSTWTVTGTKIMGPSYSAFRPQSAFTVGYRAVLSPTFSGGTSSIGGVVDGYTYLDYPLLSETLYLGGVTNSVNLSYSDNDLFFDNISANVILSTTMSWPQDFTFRFDNVFVSATESNFLKIPTGTFINYKTYAIGQLNSGEFIYAPGSTPPHVYKISDWWGPVQNNPGDYVIDIGNNYIDIQFYGAQLDADKGKFGLALWSSGTSSLSLNFPETSYPIAIKEYYTHDDGSEINNKIISLRPTGRKWRANEYLFLTMTNFYDYTDPQGLYNQDKIIFATASNPGNPIETLGKYSGVRFNIKYTRKFVGSLPFEPEPVEPGGSTYSLRPIDVGIQEKLYIGSDFDKLVTLSVTGPSYSMVGIGNERIPGKIRLGSGSTQSGGVDVVYDDSGKDCTRCDGSRCYCRRWAPSVFSQCPCSAHRHWFRYIGGTVNPLEDTEYLRIKNSDKNQNSEYTNAGLIASSIVIGASESSNVEMVVLNKMGSTLSVYQPDLVVHLFRYATNSQSTQGYEVGFDSYAISTSYLEITPVTQSNTLSPILLKSIYGSGAGETYSTLNIDSDTVSVNKINFGDVTNGQSIYVSSGDLYVNDVVFSGGGSGSQGPVGATGSQGPVGATGSQGPVGATGSQGPVGATGAAGSPNYGTQSFTDADTVSVTHSFGRYPIIQVMDTTYNPPQMFSPAKIEYTTIDSFLVTFATASSGILIYMC